MYFKERISLFIQAFRDTKGLGRLEILDAVFRCPGYYVHSYYMLLQDLHKKDAA